MWSPFGPKYDYCITTHIFHTIHYYLVPTMRSSWCPQPPLRHILIIRNVRPHPSPSYPTTRGIRSYRRRLLLQQRLLRQLIRILGDDYIVSAVIENFRDQPQILPLRQLLEKSWIFEGNLRSVVSSGRKHIYVGGLTLLSTPLPRIDNVYMAVSDAAHDNTPLQYY